MRELRALTDARVRESLVETGVTLTNYRRSDQQRLRDQETRAEVVFAATQGEPGMGMADLRARYSVDQPQALKPAAVARSGSTRRSGLRDWPPTLGRPHSQRWSGQCGAQDLCV